MKNMIKYISVLAIGLLGLSACETNDIVDEIARTSDFAPNVYMEVPSSTVSAGDSVQFSLEYWSEDQAFNYLGLWYSLHVNLKYELTSVYNQDYTYVMDSTDLVRESHEVLTYEHSESFYDEEKFSYAIEDQFPVSYTLTPSLIDGPENYDEDQINKLFPNHVIEGFYDGLFETLDHQSLMDIVVTDFEVVDTATFEGYFNRTEIEQEDEEADPVYEYTMKEDAAPVLLGHLKEVPLDGLTYNFAIPAYGIKYERGYEVRAQFRVVNGNGIENFSDEKIITVN